ncbi:MULTISPECIES: Rieske (2Fe-2S) protein [unclassified Nocardia]|uniref:Rieske (2Fe-2S) protein n=1 Tax=unclassified Nocardia TaxID=2637762 RepID=UPI00278C2993|nr:MULTISPECIES: Rieske (2Fe-2S) protein [unclassified Nocardia]
MTHDNDNSTDTDNSTPDAEPGGPRLDRRTALAGVGVAAAAVTLAACSSYGGDQADSGAPEERADGQPPAELAKTADVPVGGGLIAGDVVITQAAAGTFQGFSSTCTHAGCTVNEVSDGLIKCPCHGSSFRLDGTVASGPAARPLKDRSIRVEGDRIVSA